MARNYSPCQFFIRRKKRKKRKRKDENMKEEETCSQFSIDPITDRNLVSFTFLFLSFFIVVTHCLRSEMGGNNVVTREKTYEK